VLAPAQAARATFYTCASQQALALLILCPRSFWHHLPDKAPFGINLIKMSSREGNNSSHAPVANLGDADEIASLILESADPIALVNNISAALDIHVVYEMGYALTTHYLN